jgi:hypothetical protein
MTSIADQLSVRQQGGAATRDATTPATVRIAECCYPTHLHARSPSRLSN